MQSIFPFILQIQTMENFISQDTPYPEKQNSILFSLKEPKQKL